MMPDEELVDPSLEQKTLDEMPQFEDEVANESSNMASEAMQADAGEEIPPFPPMPSSSSPERPLPRDLETMVLGIA